MYIENTKLVREVMTTSVITCPPDKSIHDIAVLMMENNIGAIPVVFYNYPIGIITDRDIIARLLARGYNPLEFKAEQCMSSSTITIRPDTPLSECLDLMEENQIRRLVVVSDNKEVCGIVAQADIVRQAALDKSGKVVREISK